jgi:hypothetical protein
MTDSTTGNRAAPPRTKKIRSDSTLYSPSPSRGMGVNTQPIVGTNPPNPWNTTGVTSYLDIQRPSPPNEFYGFSTTAKLMHQVQGSVDHIPGTSKNTLRSTVPSRGIDGTVGSGDLFASMSTEHLEHLVLPTRDLADLLLDVYWSKVYPVAPIVYRPAFIAAVEGLWKPRNELRNTLGEGDLGIGTFGVSDSPTTLFHCALNAVLGWSCQFAGPMLSPEERDSLAQTFFLRSKKLLAIDGFDHGSLAHVQTLLLFAQCIPWTLFPTQCWNVLGFACRIGQGIGLHVERFSMHRSRRELEIRRRVWYSCMILDT